SSLGRWHPSPSGPTFWRACCVVQFICCFRCAPGAPQKYTSSCSVSRFVCRAKGAIRPSPDSWGKMPAGPSIFVFGRRCNGSTFTIFGIYPRWRQPMHPADQKNATTARTIKLDNGRLRIEDIIDIAEGSARVVLSDSHEFCAAINRGADFLDRLL